MGDSVTGDFIKASISASIGKTTIAPIERVKLLLQLQDASSQITQQNRFTGIRDCFRRVYKEQGLLSFWRGNFANVMRYFPTQAMSFTIKDFVKRSIGTVDPNINFKNFLLINIFAGGAAGGITTALMYPMDFIRTRMATDIGKSATDREFITFRDCANKIYQAEGVRGFFRGLSVALPNFIIYRALYFGLYDSSKHFFKDAGILVKFGIAQSINCFLGVLVYPLDTIRRRMMMQTGRKDVMYAGVFDCTRKIYLKEGMNGFFKGGLTNVYRSVGGALVLVIYDKLKET